MYIFLKLDNNIMITNKLDNYLILPKNACLTHVNPKPCTKCPPWEFNLKSSYKTSTNFIH
jgi:hypothetical protein